MAKKKSKRKSQGKPRPSKPPLSPRPQVQPQGEPTAARRTLEQRSARSLLFLHRLPRWLLPVIVGVLLLAGLAIPYPWAGIFLIAIAALFGWLLALSWPAITPASRAFRTIVVLLVAAAGVARFFGWG